MHPLPYFPITSQALSIAAPLPELPRRVARAARTDFSSYAQTYVALACRSPILADRFDRYLGARTARGKQNAMVRMVHCKMAFRDGFHAAIEMIAPLSDDDRTAIKSALTAANGAEELSDTQTTTLFRKLGLRSA